MLLKINITVFLIFIVFLTSINSQWLSRYTGQSQNSIDIAYGVSLDINSGNCYVTGFSGEGTEDYATVGYDAEGTQIWESRYNSIYGNSRANWIDIHPYYFDKVYITGYSQTSGYKEYRTYAYSTDGSSGWNNNPATFNSPYGDSYGTMVRVDNYGNAYVTGYSVGNGTNYDYVTIKYNNQGQQQWLARFNGGFNGDDYAYALDVNDGWVFVTGVSQTGLNDDVASYSMVTIAYDCDYGNQQWTASYPGTLPTNEMRNVIAADMNKGVYVGGISNGLTTIIKYDPTDGSQIWVNSDFNGGIKAIELYRRSGNCLIPCYTNDVYIVGAIDFKFGVAKYTDDGDLIWSRTYGNTGISRSVAIDIDANCYITGALGTYPNLDLGRAAYDSAGNVIFETYYNNSGGDDGKSIAVDSYGNWRIAGFSYASATNLDYVTMGFNQDDGDNILINLSSYKNGSSNFPKAFYLSQNYPNPFNPVTQITYGLPRNSQVQLAIYDVTGKEVAVIVNQNQTAGMYEVSVDASALNLSSGIYFYKLKAGDFEQVNKMVLVK